VVEISRDEGRRTFGADPRAYHQARPEYPPEVFEILVHRCGLRPGLATLEIGPGTGLATRHLLRLGAYPLILVEPDPRLAEFLTGHLELARRNVDLRVETFEHAPLPRRAFGLVCAASSFHWLDEIVALEKVGEILHPGGWWAVWWNSYGDPRRPDAFREATQEVFRDLDNSPASGYDGRPPFALDHDRRVERIRSVGAFTEIRSETFRRRVLFTSAELRALYATFAPLARQPPDDRSKRLDLLARIADEQFGGRVEREVLTPLYTAQRSGTSGGE